MKIGKCYVISKPRRINNEEAEKPSNDLRNILNKISKGNIDENIEKLKTILTSIKMKN